MTQQEQERLDVGFLRQMRKDQRHDWRDHVVTECFHAAQMGRGYGKMNCSDCAFASGTRYADGHVAGCYNEEKQ